MVEVRLGLECVVLAAGKGTRMRSSSAKVVHEVAGRPLLHYVLDAARGAGAARIIVVVGHDAEAVSGAAEAWRAEREENARVTLAFAVQAEQRGTGHAAAQAVPHLSGTCNAVLLLCGDTPLLRPESLAQLCAGAEAQAEAQVALLTARTDAPGAYGRIIRREGQVAAIREAKDATPQELALTEVNPGVYVFERGFLERTLPELGSHNAQGEVYLTDLVERAAAVWDLPVPFLETLGVNDQADLAEAQAVLYARRARGLAQSGVRVADLNRLQVGPDVTVAAGAALAVDVTLAGRTRVAAGAQIGQGCVLHAVEVAEDARLLPYCVASEARIGPRAQVGPFVQLRPKATLEADTKVGNFSEIKAARLGAGAKVNHLSYVGDADVGERVNLGAGTIVCNYDGMQKWPTVIEADVFVGSDCQLVAPLRIGAGAYVATGTTVTVNVPAGALAVGRARQSNKDGYATRLRKRLAARLKPTA